MNIKGLFKFTASAALAGAVLMGCVSVPHGPRSTSPEAGMPSAGHRAQDSQAARKEVEQARHLSETGNPSSMIPRLMHTIQKYPRTDASSDARYLLGETYYHIGSYREATRMFSEYLAYAPDGPYAVDARYYLNRIRDEMEERYVSPEELDNRLRNLLGELEQEPDDLENRLNLADTLWQRGNYDEAGRVYFEIVEDFPRFEHDETIANRIELTPDGRYVTLSPSEVTQREIGQRPVEILNLSGFRSGQDLLTRDARYYVVSGQALNRSDEPVHGVRVHVSIYRFGNVVYDTDTVNLGRMEPGERRDFSVRFSNFEYIENIHRQEARVAFER